jgi:hypothetical protein
MKSPIALLDSLLTRDFSRLNPGVKGLDRDFETVKRRVKHEGKEFLTLTLPTLDDALVRGLAERRFTCPPGFKKIRGGAIPIFLQGMLREVFDSKTGLLKEPIEYGILRDVHTFLLFFKKTRLAQDDEDLLHQKAVDEFYRCDETANSVELTDWQDHLIGRVSNTILKTLKHKDLEDERIYRHGPGAVQEQYKGNQKWSALYSRLGDTSLLPAWFGSTNVCLSPDLTSKEVREIRRHDLVYSILRIKPESRVRDSCTRWASSRFPAGHPELSLELSASRAEHNNRPRDRAAWLGSGSRRALFNQTGRTVPARLRGASAKLISVLKNSSSRRTITVEPFLRQYLQQGLNAILRESITECRILRNCLALTDQSKNQVLALLGSRSGKWATIDLKSASDLLSQKLVKSVFGGHAQFYECLMDSRSPYVHTGSDNGPDVAMGKFAGMGNATTFPVQSVCFAVVCIAAILSNWGVKPSPGSVTRASRLVQVYGDDIIVHSDHAHQVVKWLHDVGLKVNVKKSFLEGNFRESCGTEAYNGVDITPLYIRYWPHQIDESPNVCAHLVSLCNHLWMQGLYSTSNYLKEKVEEHLGSALPLVSSQSGSFGWHTRQEAVEPHKWCRNTHQFLTRTFALKPVKFRDELSGYAALLKCLTTPLLGRDKDHLSKTARRYQIRLVRRWVPSYSYEGLNLQT